MQPSAPAQYRQGQERNKIESVGKNLQQVYAVVPLPLQQRRRATFVENKGRKDSVRFQWLFDKNKKDSTTVTLLLLFLCQAFFCQKKAAPKGAT